jgi:hypothetical protein
LAPLNSLVKTYIERDLALLFSFLYVFVMIVLMTVYEGTGDEGDSILHYLFAKYAFIHPENFLNHWAKPVYVILVAPFAQLGFVGIKLFNTCMFALSGYLMSKTARNWDIKNADWIPIFLFTTPAAYQLVLSGLTEPLFAAWLVVGLYLFSIQKSGIAVIWLSFLPFVRSEGLIILIVTALYLIWKNRGLLLPLLVLGHVVFSLAGFFLYGDYLWVFSKMSYATTISFYGKGAWWHFFYYFTQIITPVQYFFIALGVLVAFAYAYRQITVKKRNSFASSHLAYLYAGAMAYFIAHTLFWYLGIFNSYGLTRVLLGVMPLFAVIMLTGWTWLMQYIKTPFPNIFKVAISLILVLNLIFHWDWDYHLSPSPVFEALNEANASLELKNSSPVYTGSPAVTLALGLDWFDPSERRFTNQIQTAEWIEGQPFVIWDDHFSALDDQVSLESLQNNPDLQQLGIFESYDRYFGQQRKICVFQHKGDSRTQYSLLTSDFEMESSDVNRDSAVSLSGNFSLRLDTQTPFSTGLNIFLNSVQNPTPSKIRCEFSAYSPEGSNSNSALVVFSHENQLIPFDYKSFPLNENLKDGQWIDFAYEVPVQKMKDVRDRLLVYIWNPGESPIYIDDLNIRWIRD